MITGIVFGSEWQKVLGTDGQVWFLSWDYDPGSYSKEDMDNILKEISKSFDIRHTKPSNLQWEWIKNVLNKYTTSKGDFFYISIGRSQQDVMIYGALTYVFLCYFTSDTQFDYVFCIARMK
jgi:hypothetical protein